VGSLSTAVRACESVACLRHGVIGRDEAFAAGLTEEAIARLVRSSQWRKLLPGAYLVGGAPLTWYSRLEATQSWLGPMCLFSHRTAGALLELDEVSSGLIEVAIPTAKKAPGVIVHRLAPGDRPRSRTAKGYRITDVERTLFDLFAVLPRRRAELAMEDGLRRRLTSLDRLWNVYSRVGGPGRNGSRTFRAALLRCDSRDGALASRMEAGMLRLLRMLPDPPPTPQHEVSVDGRRHFIDFAYPHLRLGIEAHSLKWHMGQERWQYDLARDRRLKRAGWTMLYYSWEDIHIRHQQTAAEILSIRNDLGALRSSNPRKN
jgi:Protein of unknown function (DUF559)